jgi:hypothetical protein
MQKSKSLYVHFKYAMYMQQNLVGEATTWRIQKEIRRFERTAILLT